MNRNHLTILAMLVAMLFNQVAGARQAPAREGGVAPRSAVALYGGIGTPFSVHIGAAMRVDAIRFGVSYGMSSDALLFGKWTGELALQIGMTRRSEHALLYATAGPAFTTASVVAPCLFCSSWDDTEDSKVVGLAIEAGAAVVLLPLALGARFFANANSVRGYVAMELFLGIGLF